MKILFFLSVVLTAYAVSAKKSDAQLCKGETFNVVPEYNNNTRECTIELVGQYPTANSTKDERIAFYKKYTENFFCISVCTFKKCKAVDDNGKYISEGFTSLIKAWAPTPIKDNLAKAALQCAVENEKAFQTDNNCAEFRKFASCRNKQINELCDWKVKPTQKKAAALTCKGETFPARNTTSNAFLMECIREVIGSFPAANATKEEKLEFYKKREEHYYCTELCILKKQKVIDSDGKLSTEALANLIKASVPKSIQDTYVTNAEHCATKTENAFSTENKCAGFGKVMLCKSQKLIELCGWDAEKKAAKSN